MKDVKQAPAGPAYSATPSAAVAPATKTFIGAPFLVVLP